MSNNFKKAAEFWKGMEISEISTGSFKTKQGVEIGTSSITYVKKQEKTEDADFELIPDEPEAPTLLRNIEDEAGLWHKNKKP